MWTSLAVGLAALVAPSQAGLRFGCSTLSIQRLDPIVQPGINPSTHVHQIIGGNMFNASVDPTIDVGNAASCTTCVFAEDFSNYWTATLYFKHRNGTYKRVKQYPNADLVNGVQGGMTVYYTQQDFNSNGNQKITAFKPGFRMTVGKPTTNTKDQAVKNTGIRYTCLQTIMTRGAETPDFPTKPCPAGIMAIHHFPACWDGKNLDSADHQSHMYDTGKGGFQVAGPCPSSHPVRMPQVALETMWNTTEFNDKSLWPTDGSQPFYWSTDDDTGYSSHADYLFGWKGDSLQKAMDSSCMFDACGNGNPLKTQNAAQMNACKIKTFVDEPVDGWLPQLPGAPSFIKA
ncbi:uncharacterized protein LY89DRAFT_651554 [Mollisia scopiformis]|uniref:DUF1996 domain-containing protein n=1 Tax=Mollisia scopiformis TaxID=149040 RepID=A0A194X086_MOLSC|nr:uncharacterized protein LY89DRAFT_651554 [Mollisia scopiformis]KUJ13369.1 hypothetical protein LY89DRAFT_651554 [Mollisia scopiformis]